MAVILVFTAVQYRLYLHIQPHQDKANALDSEQGGVLSDLIVNNHTIKLFATEEKEEKSYGRLNHQAAEARKQQYYKSIWIWGTSGFVALILEMGIMYIAIRMRGAGAISL